MWSGRVHSIILVLYSSKAAPFLVANCQNRSPNFCAKMVQYRERALLCPGVEVNLEKGGGGKKKLSSRTSGEGGIRASADQLVWVGSCYGTPSNRAVAPGTAKWSLMILNSRDFYRNREETGLGPRERGRRRIGLLGVGTAPLVLYLYVFLKCNSAR